MGVHVRRAERVIGGVAERRRQERAAIVPGDEAMTAGADGEFVEPVRDAQIAQRARRIRAQLDAGADGFEPRRLLQDDIVDPLPAQAERQGEAGHAAACDHHAHPELLPLR